MMVAMFGKPMVFRTVRCLATRRKDGVFRKQPKLPNLPIKGPRDFDYWRRLRRKNKNPKEKYTRNIPLQRPTVHKPKKKSEDREEPTKR